MTIGMRRDEGGVTDPWGLLVGLVSSSSNAATIDLCLVMGEGGVTHAVHLDALTDGLMPMPN